MRTGADENSTGRELRFCRSEEDGLEKAEEKKLCEVVDTKLGLEAIFSFAFGTGHDSCVSGEDIEDLRLREEFGGTDSHAIQRHEIKLEEVDSVRGHDVWQCGLGFGKIASGEVERCSRGIESTGCFDTDAGRAASDQYNTLTKFAFKPLIVDDLESCWSSMSWASDVLVNCCVSIHDVDLYCFDWMWC